MSENSKIEWTDGTGGPFMLCTEVSPGCANCYARDFVRARLGGPNGPIRKAYKNAGFTDWETRPVWGKTAPRVLTKGFWQDAMRINRKAEQEGVRYKWFPSMIDWLDDMPAGIIDQDGNWLDGVEVLARFLDVIRRTPNIDWLLLTKRPENFFRRMLDVSDLWENRERGTSNMEAFDWLENEWMSDNPPANVWIGTTVEDQARADNRIPLLLQIPAKVRFLSCEPLLEPVDIERSIGDARGGWLRSDGIHWVITGGESGGKCRHFAADWARDLRDQCAAAGVAFFMKQMGGARKPFPEIPPDLMIRQFPALM
jgi:protein gp37